jgi:hypothetical protein
MKNKEKSNFKIYYSDFVKDKETNKYLQKLSQLAKLNILLSKNLITKSEYEKVKYAIRFFTDF